MLLDIAAPAHEGQDGLNAAFAGAKSGPCAHGIPYIGRRERGVTLIEVLITLVVVSVGLLSLAMLQIKATTYSQSSFDRAVAVVQASDLVDRLWAGACKLTSTQNTLVSGWRTEHQLDTSVSAATTAGWSDDLVTISKNDDVFEVEIHLPIVNKNENGEEIAEIVQAAYVPAINCN